MLGALRFEPNEEEVHMKALFAAHAKTTARLGAAALAAAVAVLLAMSLLPALPNRANAAGSGATVSVTSPGNDVAIEASDDYLDVSGWNPDNKQASASVPWTSDQQRFRMIIWGSRTYGNAQKITVSDDSGASLVLFPQEGQVPGDDLIEVTTYQVGSTSFSIGSSYQQGSGDLGISFSDVTGPLHFTVESNPIPVDVRFFDNIDGEGGDEVASFTEEEGTNLYLKDPFPASSLPDMTGKNEGYTFAGWNTKPDGSGLAFDTTSPLLTFERYWQSGVDLYAQWKPIAPADIAMSFYLNTDDPAADGQLLAAPQFAPDDPITDAQLPVPAADANPGYTFAGWNSEPDGTGATLEAGATAAACQEAGTLTWYAQWKKEEAPAPTPEQPEMPKPETPASTTPAPTPNAPAQQAQETPKAAAQTMPKTADQVPVAMVGAAAAVAGCAAVAAGIALMRRRRG